MNIRFSFFWSAITILLALVIFNVYQSSSSLTADNEPRDKQQTIRAVSINQSFRVVIDAGHGGKDSGSEGASGLFEKDFTLSLSKKIVEQLEKDPDFEVFMTREDDRFLSAKDRDRPKFANDLDADIYISIHGNTFMDPSVSGTETFYFSEESLELANIIHKHLINATGFSDREVKEEEYYVLKDTTMPAVLLEIGYLTNPEDEQTMFSQSFQDTVAVAIYEGILEYSKLQ